MVLQGQLNDLIGLRKLILPLQFTFPKIGLKGHLISLPTFKKNICFNIQLSRQNFNSAS